MKKFQIAGLTALTLFGSLASVQAQATTAPVGYVTTTLKEGFNLIGLTLHQQVVVSGTIDTVSGTTLTENDTTFTDNSVLGASGSATFILEITSGSLTGTTQDITSWTANTLITPDNLDALGLTGSVTYQIRKSSTIADIFGAANEATLPASASSASAALVWVIDPAETNGFARYYYNTGGFGQSATWRKISAEGTQTNVTASDIYLPYLDAMYVQMPSGASNLDLVVTGSVISSAHNIPLVDTFNYVGSIFPAGSTLANSGLKDTLSSTASSVTSDLVWIQQSDGTYLRYYYNAGGFGQAAEWKAISPDNTQTSAGDGSTINLPSAVIIQKNGADKDVIINPGF